MARVLLTGAHGFLGAHVRRALDARHDVAPHGPRRVDGDLAEAATLARVAASCPERVVHLAAMTDPNACAREPDAARRANSEASARLATAVSSTCERFIYASTDLVFDGEGRDYTEDDAPSPISLYGESKLEGERAVHAVLGPRVVVARLALLYGPRLERTSRESFAETIVARGRRSEPMNLFEDEYRTPLYVEDAAENLLRLLELSAPPALVHLGGPERCSRYAMGRVALAVFGLPTELARPCRVDEHVAPALRPKDVSLDCTRARRLGLEARGLRAGFTLMKRHGS